MKPKTELKHAGEKEKLDKSTKSILVLIILGILLLVTAVILITCNLINSVLKIVFPVIMFPTGVLISILSIALAKKNKENWVNFFGDILFGVRHEITLSAFLVLFSILILFGTF